MDCEHGVPLLLLMVVLCMKLLAQPEPINPINPDPSFVIEKPFREDIIAIDSLYPLLMMKQDASGGIRVEYPCTWHKRSRMLDGRAPPQCLFNLNCFDLIDGHGQKVFSSLPKYDSRIYLEIFPPAYIALAQQKHKNDPDFDRLWFVDVEASKWRFAR